MEKRNRSGQIEISFGWLFAIVAGIAIIFAAIYLSSKFIQSGQESISAKTGKEIGTLLDPLETSFESAQTTSITIPSETRINNKCKTSGLFGEQFIQLDQKSFNKWVETDVNVGFNNKYLFSEEEIEGKTFYIFSKPFNFPFKIADLFYVTSSKKEYCFADAPDEIKDELSKLNQSNLILTNCPDKSTKVCFGSKKCEINVNYAGEYVEKNDERMYFSGLGEDSTALMYGAIFSNKTVYECQVSRLIMRMKELSIIYKNKEELTAKKGCETNMGADLITLSTSIESPEELSEIKTIADSLDEKNKARGCLLW
jgi:hypothetical protein